MILPSKAIAAGALWGILTFPGTEQLIYELGNGSVKLENPMNFQGSKLKDPRFLGSGGGGAAFAYSRDLKNDVVVKFSWLGSAESVRNECQILQVMDERKISGVEHCLGAMAYSDDPRRSLIVMEPVIEDAVSNVADIPLDLQPKTASALVRTMVQMLAANVVTTDVQPLISQSTGQVILIDMTEARLLKVPFAFIDVALMSSFCTEVLNLIPESMLEVASQSLLSELSTLENRGVNLPAEAIDILRSQALWTEEIQDYLDMYLK
jgi:hypothetical protein